MMSDMKFAILVLALIYSASAAPAVVWKSGKNSQAVTHSSDRILVADVLADTLTVESRKSLPSVVFLLGRQQDGSDALTSLASQGALPGVASKYDGSHTIYYHVSGMESAHTVVRDASRAAPEHKVLAVSLAEYSKKMASLDETTQEMEVSENGKISNAQKREQEIEEANCLIVYIDADTDAAEVDRAIIGAIEHSSIDNVVLGSVRSTDEVKLERVNFAKRRQEAMQITGSKLVSSSRRRLEEEQEEEQDAEDGNNANEDVQNIHYVHMTPNIMAGLLFGLMFTLVTFLGISCMGEIRGQHVFVSKMPSVGREA